MPRFSAILLACLTIPLAIEAGEPDTRPITPQEREHWAFQTPIRPTVPDVKARSWVHNPIDAFVLAELETLGLAPSPEADRATLLRRLSFDLTGLPPSIEEQDRFLNDRSADAYERLVDRLLSSPGYGVRQAQLWLDLARFADTDGFEFDQIRPNAWRYRDWVVDAFNSDLPYDQFVRLQLAGDEVAPDSLSAFVATGFNRCYPDMVDLNDQTLRRQNALNDITDTTGLVFLGLTIGCARCHDHKSDPIRITDYYALQAHFTPARFRDDYPIGTVAERTAYEKAMGLWRERVASLQSQILAIETPVRDMLTPTPVGAVQDDVIQAMRKEPGDRTPAEVGLVFELWARDKRIKPQDWARLLGPQLSLARALLINALADLRRQPPPPLPLARGVDETGKKPAETYVLIRGEHTRRGKVVGPLTPMVLERGEPASRPTARSSGRRTALADWLVDARNPLTARVIVNRLWLAHFGRGIVATPSDFGKSGAEPTHPELLDWLATELIWRGWSLKSMHRLIVMSSTYRQSSLARAEALKLDPDNSVFWRQNRKRLEGEAIRDAMLTTAGRLNPALAGPPVFPELPAELTRLSSKGDVWPVSRSAADRDRRSLYVFVRRNLRYPFFEVFDRPDTNASCPRRPVSTIAPQALTLFNGGLAQEAAKGFASRICSTQAADDARLALAFRIAYGRLPTDTERTACGAFLKQNGVGWEDLTLALINANEFIYID